MNIAEEEQGNKISVEIASFEKIMADNIEFEKQLITWI